MPKTLLLADDSVTIQKVVAISFASEDIKIATVDNGDSAVTRARELHPDVILADVVMPGKSGYEVCEAVKADPTLRDIPVLLLTGTFEAFDEERAQRAGAAGHVAKPFEAQALVRRVKELLSTPAPAATPAAPPVAAATAAASDDDAFAFFDDEAGRGGDDEAYQGNGLSTSELELAPGDSAFSFGDEDWSDDSSDEDFEPLQPAAHTVAMLPDDEPADTPARPVAAAGSAHPETVLEVSPEPESEDDRFDFEFETRSPRLHETRIDSFAQGAVLDPPADSGFIDPAPSQGFEPPPRPETPAAEATQILGSDFELARVEPLERSSVDQATDPFPDEPEVALAADPVDDEPDATAFFEESPIPPLRAREPAERPTPLAAPAVDLAAVEPDYAEPEGGFAEPETLEPEPERSAPDLAVGEVDAEAMLRQIAPQLRDQLHETLERAAWEAFGQVTEKIVAQTVEKLETIAWEVVPKLAETLIQEEIRKLKGE